jgi:Domain of unknown function (DUF4307)
MTGFTDLDTRYGRKRGLTPVQRHALTVVALLLGTLAAYLVFRNSEQSIQSAERSHQVLNDHQDLVTYEVHKPKAWTVTCVIRARGEDGNEVGRKTITIPPGKSVVVAAFTLPTSAKAITGEIQDCAKA